MTRQWNNIIIIIVWHGRLRKLLTIKLPPLTRKVKALTIVMRKKLFPVFFIWRPGHSALRGSGLRIKIFSRCRRTWLVLGMFGLLRSRILSASGRTPAFFKIFTKWPFLSLPPTDPWCFWIFLTSISFIPFPFAWRHVDFLQITK